MMIIMICVDPMDDLCAPMRRLSALTLLFALASGCTTTDRSQATLARDTGHIGVIAEIPAPPQGPVVQLDHGRRWKANTGTTEGIRSMLLLVERHPKSGLTKLQLKDSLEAEFRMIIERCTMTGEGHEQLHNYLVPLHKMLGAFGDHSTGADLMTMHAHLQTYGEYFE
jgi:hypothetical protein